MHVQNRNYQRAALPKISIIMPVLNRGDTIERAIQSVIDQHYGNTELIIIDGGSKDKTVEILKKYSNHINYWHSQLDDSAAMATNEGIRKASGDLIALLMADDWYEPNLFHKIAHAYNNHPEFDMISCYGKLVYLENHKIKRFYDKTSLLKISLYNITLRGLPLICMRFIKKEYYNKIGLYINKNKLGGQLLSNDREFMLRAYFDGCQNYIVPCYGYVYCGNPFSFSFSGSKQYYATHCLEHRMLAKIFLNSAKYSIKNNCLLAYWYCDQSMRLCFYYLFCRRFLAASRVIKMDLIKFNIFWCVVIMVVPLIILFRRLIYSISNGWRFFFRKFKK